jgi:hypothetical protein
MVWLSKDTRPDGRSIGGLPDEVLSAIFHIGKEFGRQSMTSSAVFPELASHVCGRWRNIVLSDPLLWTRVTFQIIGAEHVDLKTQRQEEYIRRSGACPLDIYICTGRELSSDNVSIADACLTHVIDLLIPHAPRWKSVIVGFASRAGAIDVFHRMQPLYVPQLEYLRLSFAYDPQDVDISHTAIFRNGAPSLLIVRYSGFGLHRCPPPLASLRELQLYSSDTTDMRMAPDEFCALLKTAPLLESLKLVGFIVNFDNNAEIGTSPRVTIPSLRNLTVAWGQQDFFRASLGLDSYFPCLMACLDVPNLLSLYIHGLVGYSPLGRFLDYIIRCSGLYANLKTLRLDSIQEEIDSRIWLCFPSIKHLILGYISCRSLMRQLEDACINESERPLPWPKLQCLSTVHAYAEFASAIRACIDAGHPLRTVCVTSSDPSFQELGIEVKHLDPDLRPADSFMNPSLAWSRDEPGYVAEPMLPNIFDLFEDDEDEYYEDEDEYDNDNAIDDYVEAIRYRAYSDFEESDDWWDEDLVSVYDDDAA